MKTAISDLIVVVPGIPGSVLERRGRVVWDKSWRTAFKLLTADRRFLSDLALNRAQAANDPDAVHATRLVDGPSMIPGLARLGGYSRIASFLDHTFALVSRPTAHPAPPNYLEFPYDWRLDNRHNAGCLAAFLAPRLAAWRRHAGADAWVIIFAHSMGGLVARYYTEVLGGWRDTRLLVTFGTPHRGSVSALQTLLSGYRGLGSAVTETLRTFPSIYQLLPRYDFIEYEGIPRAYRTHTAPALPGIDQQRASEGHEFHLEIEQAVRANLANEHYRQRYSVVPVIGTHQATLQRLIINKSGAHHVSSTGLIGMPSDLADGDGTVPRVSAIPIEQSDDAWHVFMPERHSALVSSRYSLTAVCEPIRHMQGLGGWVRHYRDHWSAADQSIDSAIRTDIPDLVYAGEPTPLRAKLVGCQAVEQQLVATIVDARTQQAVLTEPLARVDEEWQLDVAGLPEGMYEATVGLLPAHFGGPSPVHDVFAVLEPH